MCFENDEAAGPRMCHAKPMCDRRLNVPPSLPTRGAWIETAFRLASSRVAMVAPHAGSVD
jgi:hypothetical protein